MPPIKAGTNASFGALKQIDAGVLNIGYAEAGPANGPVVVLLHGWPYDIHSFVDVAPMLAGAGYRVIIPYLRGYGTTQFLSSAAIRNGQPSALAVDLKDFLDALKIEKPISCTTPRPTRDPVSLWQRTKLTAWRVSNGSFATDRCVMKVGPCPQCPEGDGCSSKRRRSRWAISGHLIF